MKLLIGLVGCSIASPIGLPVIIGGKDAEEGQFPHQGEYLFRT